LAHAPILAAPPTTTLSQRLIRNAGANFVRMVAFGIVAVVVPMVLVRRLPPASYNAWILILQLGAYVNFLDLGLQTALSKYIAEYDASGDQRGCDRITTNGLALLLGTAALGTLFTLGMGIGVPHLFPQMPAGLMTEVRWAVIFYGISMALSLPSSAFAGVFLGLQRNAVPMFLQSSNKLLTGLVTIACVFLHTRIRTMGLAVAGVNVAFALAQVVSWRSLASHIRVRFSLVERKTVITLVRYCSVLTLWGVAGLFVTGFDTVIVGHYDFRATAYYAASANATSFLIALLGVITSPLIPATSAMSVHLSPRAMGNLLLRATRYNIAVMLIAGLPLLLFSFLILRTWMGGTFALQGVPFLRILLIGIMIRMIGLPYAVMVIGTAKQWLASLSPICEAVVNFTVSIILVRRIGAVGVAWGTVIGAFVSIGLHFTVSMALTQDKLAISPVRLLTRGVLLPLAAAIPTALAFRYWWGITAIPAMSSIQWSALAISTVALLWYITLDDAARRKLLRGA
jgi:O-antigen/teichoic acid export membrane protein